MKERFGRPKGPSKEDIEREAEKELARLTRNAPGRSAGGSSGGGFGGPGEEMATPLDEIASSVRSGRPSAPNLGVLGTVGAGPGGYKGGPGDFDRGLGGYGGPSARRGGTPGQGPAPGLPADFEDPEEESATITELALRDLAARDGTNPEDLIIHQDPGMAEAMRDEAMRRFFDRQQTRQPAATGPPIDPANTVLGRIAARRKAEEEGRPFEDDAPAGGGLLDRVRQREEAAAAEARRAAAERPASVGRLQGRRGGKSAYEVDDDDDYDGPQGLRARVTAKRDASRADTRAARVFAMPAGDDEDDHDAPVPELDAMVARLSKARAEAVRRGDRPAASPKKAPGRVTKKTKAPATKAPVAKAPSRATKKTKAPATKALASKRAVATTRAPAKKAVAARRAPAEPKAKPVRSSTGRAPGAAPVRTNVPSATTERAARPAKAPAKARATKGARRR